MSEGPYARVYWSIRSDPRTRDLYRDDALLAAWLRLLIAADMAWPAPADIPVGIRKASLKALVDAGVVELLDGGSLFTFHGLDKERSRRSTHARTAASARWNAPSIAQSETSNAETMLAKQSRAKQSRADHADGIAGADGATDDPAVALFDRTARYPSAGLLKWIGRLAETHGEARLADAIRSAPAADTPGDYLQAAENELRRQDHDAQKAEDAAERIRLAQKRAPVVSPAIAQLRAALMAREQEGDVA